MTTPSLRAGARPPPAVATPLPHSLFDVLESFQREHGTRVRLWQAAGDGWVVRFPEVNGGGSAPGAHAAEVPDPGPNRIRVEVVGGSPARAKANARYLAGVLHHLLKHDKEARLLGYEIAERYEEITLLYTISEILGSVIDLEEAATDILAEVVLALGVRRATLWVYDPAQRRLDLGAVHGGDGQTGPIDVDDPCSVTAKVFREREPIILEPGEDFPRGDCPPVPASREWFLSVAVSYTPPDGETRTVGVINLVGSVSGEPFSSGSLKLISAIASQVGAAVENSRLVAESLRRERMVREMELAHDLQLKLLPSLTSFDGFASVAARCVQAESVGGDFYHLIKLPGRRLGVMIGDVSSHGFAAALIMALAMSAASIHAAEDDEPAEVLQQIHETLIGELESTEMYLTLFYGVIDPDAGRITFANAGHPHAFRIPASGSPERLPATNPPLGFADPNAFAQTTATWTAGEDMLFLFTDGLSDALQGREEGGEAMLVSTVAANSDQPVAELIDRVFSLRGGDGSVPLDDRTAVLLRF